MAHINSIALYVEDEESDRLLMRFGFAHEDLAAELRIVNDGQEAKNYLSGTPPYQDREENPLPAVVLLDLNLPEVHGFDVLKWIRAHPVHTRLPVVVFSSSDHEDDHARAHILGANELLRKPGSPMLYCEVARKLNEWWLLRSPAVVAPLPATG